MRGSRFVEAKVGFQRVRFDFPRNELMQHEHVSLLDHLTGGDAFGSEEEVGGDGPSGRDLGDAQRLEIVEARPLGVWRGVWAPSRV